MLNFIALDLQLYNVFKIILTRCRAAPTLILGRPGVYLSGVPSTVVTQLRAAVQFNSAGVPGVKNN